MRLLSVGPTTWIAGYEFALSGVRLLVDRGGTCEYRIVGSGPHQDAVAFACHQLGLDGCVELLPSASPDELRAHLRWADVLVDAAVAPTASEPLLNGPAAGIPVVTTQPSDYESPTVVAVPPRDPQALCDALARL